MNCSFSGSTSDSSSCNNGHDNHQEEQIGENTSPPLPLQQVSPSSFNNFLQCQHLFSVLHQMDKHKRMVSLANSFGLTSGTAMPSNLSFFYPGSGATNEASSLDQGHQGQQQQAMSPMSRSEAKKNHHQQAWQHQTAASSPAFPPLSPRTMSFSSPSKAVKISESHNFLAAPASSFSEHHESVPKFAQNQRKTLPLFSHRKPAPSSQAKINKSCSSPSLVKESTSDIDMEYYPDGNVLLQIENIKHPGRKRSTPIVGWAMATSNKRTNPHGCAVIYKHCLGVYKCQHCCFVQTPRQDQVKKRKWKPPLPPKGTCLRHPDDQLQWQSCKCEMVLTEQHDRWLLKHSGHHNHPPPPPSKVGAKAFQQFERLVKDAPQVGARALKLGGPTRQSVIDIHPAFMNQDRVKHLKLKVLKPMGMKSTIAALVNFKKSVNKFFIIKDSLTCGHAHIIMQNQDMKELLNAGGSPLQTDTVEGFISESELVGEANVTLTSSFCFVLQQWVPVLVSILFGKSADHYNQHWKALFESYSSSSWEEFTDVFIGNSSDFSDGIRKAFTTELSNFAKKYFDKTLNHDNIPAFYRFCDVHFERSRSRVARNSGVVKLEDQDKFNEQVRELRAIPEGCFASFKMCCLKFFKAFPNAQSWLCWCLNIARAPIVFPACRKLTDVQQKRIDLLSKDTNAQENVGKQFQEAFIKDKATVGEAVLHSFKFCNVQRLDRNAVLSGMQHKYGHFSRDKKTPISKRWKNDGRAPDTSKALLSRSSNKKRKASTAGSLEKKRMSRRSSNGAGASCSARTEKSEEGEGGTTFKGIPWSVPRSGDRPAITNTCRLDSFLDLMFLLNEHKVLSNPMIELQDGENIMSKSFALMREGKHDDARFLWVDDKRMLRDNTVYSDGTINMWGSVYEMLCSIRRVGVKGETYPLHPSFEMVLEQTRKCSLEDCNKRQKRTRTLRPTYFDLGSGMDYGQVQEIFLNFLDKEEIDDAAKIVCDASDCRKRMSPILSPKKVIKWPNLMFFFWILSWTNTNTISTVSGACSMGVQRQNHGSQGSHLVNWQPLCQLHKNKQVLDSP